VTNGTITAIEPTRGVGDGDFDADGANLMPGLWDNHTHFSLAALISQCTRFSHKATKSEILAAVEDHLRHRPPRLVGYGFRSATWPAPPTTADLDAITTVPVALMSRDLHSLWCNTPALEQAGAAGHPTGFLVEEEAFAGIRRIMSRYLDLVEHAVQAAELEAASRGLVGIVDFSSGWAVEAWQQRAASRSIGLRVEAATYAHSSDDMPKRNVVEDLKAAEDMMNREVTGVDVAKALSRGGFEDVAQAVFNLLKRRVAGDYLHTSAIFDADFNVISAVNSPNDYHGPQTGYQIDDERWNQIKTIRQAISPESI